MNKTVNNVNRKLTKNPIRPPFQSEISDEGISVQHINNSVHIAGDVENPQIGGSSHIQVNLTNIDVQSVLVDIKQSSKVLDSDDRLQLILILEELQSTGNEESKNDYSFQQNFCLFQCVLELLLNGLQLLVQINLFHIFKIFFPDALYVSGNVRFDDDKEL